MVERDPHHVVLCLADISLPVTERVWFHQSISFLDLSTFFWSSTTKKSSSCTWAHLSQALSLLPSDTSGKIGHTLQLETWMAACFLGSSVWVAGCSYHREHRGHSFLSSGHHCLSPLQGDYDRVQDPQGSWSGWWGCSPSSSYCPSAAGHPCCCLVSFHTKAKSVRGS